jgi:hypothetical protein
VQAYSQANCIRALTDLQTDLDTGTLVMATVDWLDLLRCLNPDQRTRACKTRQNKLPSRRRPRIFVENERDAKAILPSRRQL